MERKYQIFISSTFEDLKEERNKVRDAILSIMHFPVGMELFGAANEESWDIIKETIDSTDYYVLIIANRYGSLADDGISFTEKEFQYAESQEIPVLAFIKSSDSEPLAKNIDKDPKKAKKLKKFIESVTANHNVDYWSSADELSSKVIAALHKQMNRKKRPGWIRGDSIDFEKSYSELLVLNGENRKLREENDDLHRRLSMVSSREPLISVGIEVYDLNDTSEGGSDVPDFSDEKSVDDVMHEKREKKSLTTINSDSEQTSVDEMMPKDKTIIQCHKVPRHGHISNTEPLTMEMVPSQIRNYVSQDQLDEYNANIPEKSIIDSYEKKAYWYKLMKYDSTEIRLCIDNFGTAKATNINIKLSFPNDLIPVKMHDIKSATIPEKPEMPENPIDKAWEKYYKKHNPALYFDDSMIRELKKSPALSGGFMGFSSPVSSRISSLVTDVDISSSLYDSLIIESNIVSIWVKNIQHTGRYDFDNCTVIPVKPGIYEVQCSIMCDEYIEPKEQVLYIEALDAGYYREYQ